MKTLKHTLITMACLIGLAMAPLTSHAGDGHDHGEAPATAGGPALPRFTVSSELFELVGIVNGKQITLYLDRFTDGSPVKDAKLELEIGGTKVPVQPHGEGEFEATLTQELKQGVIPVAVTVMAANDTDLLAGEIDLHDAAAGAAAHRHGWQEYALWAAIGLAVLILLAWFWQRHRASRNKISGGVA